MQVRPRPEPETPVSVAQQLGGFVNEMEDLNSEGDAGSMANLCASMAGELNLDASGSAQSLAYTTTAPPTGVTRVSNTTDPTEGV